MGTCPYVGKIFKLLAVSFGYSELAHLGLEGGSLHSKPGGRTARAGEDPVGGLESLEDVLALGGAQCERLAERFGRGLEFAEGNAEHGTGRDDHGALDQVFQFADV